MQVCQAGYFTLSFTRANAHSIFVIEKRTDRRSYGPAALYYNIFVRLLAILATIVISFFDEKDLRDMRFFGSFLALCTTHANPNTGEAGNRVIFRRPDKNYDAVFLCQT